MNLGQLKESVKRQFGDEAAVQVTDADILRWLEQGQNEIVIENEEILDERVLADIVANQDEYPFPTDALTIRSIRVKSNQDELAYKPIPSVSTSQFEKSVAGYQTILHTMDSPYIWTGHKGAFFLYPIPQVTVVDGMRILYAKKPTMPALDADVLGLPLAYHNQLLQYCLIQAYEMDENWEGAGNKLAQLQAGLNRRANRSTSEGRDVYPTITVLPEDM
jgi:hypothetical protein